MFITVYWGWVTSEWVLLFHISSSQNLLATRCQLFGLVVRYLPCRGMRLGFGPVWFVGYIRGSHAVRRNWAIVEAVLLVGSCSSSEWTSFIGAYDEFLKFCVDSVGTAGPNSWERRRSSGLRWQSSSNSMMMVFLSLGGLSGMAIVVDSWLGCGVASQMGLFGFMFFRGSLIV